MKEKKQWKRTVVASGFVLFGSVAIWLLAGRLIGRTYVEYDNTEGSSRFLLSGWERPDIIFGTGLAWHLQVRDVEGRGRDSRFTVEWDAWKSHPILSGETLEVYKNHDNSNFYRVGRWVGTRDQLDRGLPPEIRVLWDGKQELFRRR